MTYKFFKVICLHWYFILLLGFTWERKDYTWIHRAGNSFFVFSFSTFLLCWLFSYYSSARNLDNKRPISLLHYVHAKVIVVQKTFNQAMEA